MSTTIQCGCEPKCNFICSGCPGGCEYATIMDGWEEDEKEDQEWCSLQGLCVLCNSSTIELLCNSCKINGPP
jgi:hypothetical protein